MTQHFQRDIVRGVEGHIVTGSKQIEIGTKLCEDARKYGADNTCTSSGTLSKAALSYSMARAQMEKERDNLLKALETQVAEPLRSMVVGAPLEEARHLAQQYDRVRQEAESQAIEVSRRQARARESNSNPDYISKLDSAEIKLHELQSNMLKLGKEASSAMAAVEAQQQRLTLQKLITIVEAEHSYHQRILQLLDQLEAEMLSKRHGNETLPTPPPPPYNEASGKFMFQAQNASGDGTSYFLGEVMHPYLAESNVELTLSIGDYVVVRQVRSNGWAEGECKGRAGWFPVGYVERREHILASKVAEVF